MSIYPAGVQTQGILTGAEYVDIDNGGAVTARTTTAAIAALGGNFGTDSPQNVTATVGTTLTAAQVTAGLINRTGPTAIFSDTTPTAAQLAAVVNAPSYPNSFYIDIKNTTAFTETLLNGTGVTFSSNNIVPPNSISEYLVVMSSATAAVFNHVFTNLINVNEAAQFSTAALSVGTLAVGAITGANFVVLQNTGATPGAQTVRTAAQMLADFPNGHVGMSYQLRIVNAQAGGSLTLTADAGATVTITGHAIVAANTFVDYVVTFNTATAATIQSIGSGTSP